MSVSQSRHHSPVPLLVQVRFMQVRLQLDVSAMVCGASLVCIQATPFDQYYNALRKVWQLEDQCGARLYHA